MSCFPWLLALFSHSRRRSYDATSQPSTPPLSSEYSIGIWTIESKAQLPKIAGERDSINSVEAPAITVQTFVSVPPQLPPATVNRDSIGSMEAPTSMRSTSSLSPDYPKITIRSIKYPEKRLQSAEIAYSIGRRGSWHWLPYKRLVEKYGEDDIRKFNPMFRDGL